MGTQGGEHLFRCPCYDDHTEYQKIVELKDAGLVIYRQTSRHEDGSLDLDLALPSASTEDIFILHNTKDIEILSADIMPAFEQNKISCLRCRHIIENAQKLLKSIPKINRNDIMGICDHCRRKISRSPCKECDEVVQKFVSDRDKGKDAKRHIRVWLSKIHHLLRDVVIGERNIFKQKSRSYSDINIDNLHHNSPVSMREPEVTDLFYSENLKTGSTRTLHMSDRSCYSHPGFPKIKKKTTFLDYLEQEKNYLSPSQGKPYHSRSYDDLSYINYELPLIEAQRGEFRKRKLITDLTSNRLSVPPITSIHGKYHSEESILPLGKYHSEESVYPVTKYQYLSDDTLIPQEKRQLEARYVSHGRYKPDGLILAHRKQTPDERILAHRKRSPEERLKPRIRYSEDEMYMTIGKHSPEDRQRLMTHRKRSDEERQRFMMHGKYSEEDRFLHGKYTPENRLSPHRKYTSEERLTAHEKHTRKESLTPYRKHKSEETLVTSISGIIEDHLKQDFGYFFPHEVEDTVKIRKKRISSSELIKDTQDKLQARAEEERIRLEEERRRKREEEEQKRIAKEKARLLREEAKRLAEEAKRRAEEEKRKAEEEEKRLAEEERKRLEEEEKKRLAEEEKKKRAEERQKKLIEKEKKPPKPESVKKVKEALPEKKKAPAEKLKSKERLPEKPKVREPPPEKPKVKEPPPEKPPTKLPSPEKPKVKEPSSEKPPVKQPSPEKPKVKEPPPPPPPPPEVPKVKPPSPEKPKNEPPPDIPKPEPKEKPKKEKPEAVAKEKKEKKEKEPVATEVKEPVKEEVKESVKPKPEPKPEPTPGEDFRKLVEEQAKLKEERLRLRKLKEEEERKAREAAEKKAKEMDQAAKTEIKASKKTETEKPKPQKQQEQPTTKDLNIKQIKLKNPSVDDLILRLVKMKQANQGERLIKNEMSGIPRILYNHKGHKNTKDANCLVCTDSDIELDLESITNKRDEIKMADIIIGPKIFKYKPPIPPPPDEQKHEQILPIVFKSTYKEETVSVVEKTENIPTVVTVEPEKKPPPLLVPTKGSASAKGKQPVELEVPKGIVRYALSDRSFIDKGWTMLPTEKVVRKMNVYRMRPAHPEFDWFEHNKNKRLMTYDTGEKLAEFDDNGRGRWYYKNGRLALDYYDAEEINAQQRFVVYSSGEPDERGRSRPITILATFDYLGNGIVFDHSGKIRLKYNQTEGVVLDRAIGPVSHWKWHTLNDPPVLQQVMIDTQMPHKDPDIIKLGGPGDNKARPDNEEMLAIEFDNFIKEKSKKLTQKFKPFQIKMKALKINESFSLRVLDQATIYLIFRDGSANLKLNIGMILDHKEIVDTDTAEVGEVSNNLQRLPARTDSIAGLQRSVAHAQRVERLRVERERRLRPAEPCGSADRLTAAAARPLRAPFRTASDSTVPTTSQYPCKCRKPSSCNLYYDTRLF